MQISHLLLQFYPSKSDHSFLFTSHLISPTFQKQSKPSTPRGYSLGFFDLRQKWQQLGRRWRERNPFLHLYRLSHLLSNRPSSSLAEAFQAAAEVIVFLLFVFVYFILSLNHKFITHPDSDDLPSQFVFTTRENNHFCSLLPKYHTYFKSLSRNVGLRS